MRSRRQSDENRQTGTYDRALSGNHNFWDIRRWKMADTLYFNVKVRGLNILAETMEDFAKIVEIQDKRTFDAPPSVSDAYSGR